MGGSEFGAESALVLMDLSSRGEDVVMRGRQSGRHQARSESGDAPGLYGHRNFNTESLPQIRCTTPLIKNLRAFPITVSLTLNSLLNKHFHQFSTRPAAVVAHFGLLSMNVVYTLYT